MSRRYITVAEQRQISERAGHCCEYCRCPKDYSSQSFAVEHIVPVAKGGETSLENLALSCGGCNNHKYTKVEAVDPLNGQKVPLFHPRRDVWSEHFGWTEDGLRMVGLTAVGRATVEALNVNREGVVNIRQLLVMAGLHPPK